MHDAERLGGPASAQAEQPDHRPRLEGGPGLHGHQEGRLHLVFHPHGWIKAEQMIDLIDHAQSKYGKKVKFLTFKECEERLTRTC